MSDEVGVLLNNISVNIEYQLEDSLKETYALIEREVMKYVWDNRFLNNVDTYGTKRIISRYFRELANSAFDIRSALFQRFTRLTEHVDASKDISAINRFNDDMIDEIKDIINPLIKKGLAEFDSSFLYDLKYELLMGVSSSVPYDVIIDFKRVIGNKVEDNMDIFKTEINQYVAKKIDLLSDEYKEMVKRDTIKEKEQLNENELGLYVKKKIEIAYSETEPFIHENESLFNAFKEMYDCCDDLLSQNADFSDFDDERISHFYKLMDNFAIEFKRVLDKKQKEKQDKTISKFKQVDKNKSAEKIPDGKKLSRPISWEDTRAGKLL